ncbi:MAG: hypothetical protein KA392_13750, partial [Candidatus Obscuribacter sp.]|nr:hypothetical protein [Candidatus Obscuribacter sp.]
MLHNESDFESQSQSLAEYIVLGILVLMVAVPVSGVVLTAQSWASSLFTKGAYQVQNTKNLAE